MKHRKQEGDVLELISSAKDEAKEMGSSGGEDAALTCEILAARYRQVMDAAEMAISNEYKSSGSLTGVKVCEINKEMDGYAMTVQSVLERLQRQEQE